MVSNSFNGAFTAFNWQSRSFLANESVVANYIIDNSRFSH